MHQIGCTRQDAPDRETASALNSAPFITNGTDRMKQSDNTMFPPGQAPDQSHLFLRGRYSHDGPQVPHRDHHHPDHPDHRDHHHPDHPDPQPGPPQAEHEGRQEPAPQQGRRPRTTQERSVNIPLFKDSWCMAVSSCHKAILPSLFRQWVGADNPSTGRTFLLDPHNSQ